MLKQFNIPDHDKLKLATIPKPHAKFLIRKLLFFNILANEDLKEMIKDALANRNKWDDYVKGKDKPYALFKRILNRKI